MDDNQIFADMALHALETDIADLERLVQLPADRAALLDDLTRIGKCSTRLADLIQRVRGLERVMA